MVLSGEVLLTLAITVVVHTSTWLLPVCLSNIVMQSRREKWFGNITEM